MSTVKKPFEFQKQTVPPHLIKLMRGRGDDGITKTDLLIMFAIDSMTKHYEDGTGKGCFMNNAALARAADCHDKHVQKRLSDLEKRGLILRVEYKGKRYLELEWGRMIEERENLVGTYGDLLRQAFEKAAENAKSFSKEKGEKEGGSKNAPPLEQKCGGEQKCSPVHKHSKNSAKCTLSIRARDCRPSRHGTESESEVEVSAQESGSTPVVTSPDFPCVTTNKEKMNDPAYKVAITLSHVLKKCGINTPDKYSKKDYIASWARRLRPFLIDHDHELVIQSINWYGDNHQDRYTPSINGVISLIQKYHGLRAAMRRSSECVTPLRGDAQATLELSEDAKQALAQLRELKWIKGSSKYLAAAVQQSICSLEQFRKAHRKLYRKQRDDNVGIFARHYDLVFSDPVYVVVEHFTKLHSRYYDWDKWSGKLKPFTHDSEAFDTWGRDLGECMGSEEYWEEYVAAVRKLMK